MRRTRIPLAILSLIVSFFLAPVSAETGAASSVAPDSLIRKLVGTRYINDLALSPDHRTLTYQVLSRDVDANVVNTAWWIARLDRSNAPTKVADGGAAFGFDGMQDEPPVWSSDSKQLYYRKLDHGQVQIWQTNVATAQSRQLTHDKADILPVIFEDSFLLDDDHNRLFYSVAATRAQTLSAEDRERADGIRLSARQELNPPLAHNEYWNGRMATMRRDPVRLISLLTADSPIRVMIADVRSGATHNASPVELVEYDTLRRRRVPVNVDKVMGAIPWSLSADSGRVAIGESKPVGDKLGDLVMTTVSWRSVTGGDEVRCVDPRCTGRHIKGVSWWDNDKQILFFSRELGQTHILSWNVASGLVREVLSTTEVLNPGIVRCCSGRGGHCPTVDYIAYCAVSDANEPPALIALNLKSGDRTVMFDPNVELRRITTVFDAKHMIWTDQYGRRFHGVLVAPLRRMGRKVPLIITSYNCGGFLVGASGQEMPEFALADSGIAALCIEADASIFEQSYPGNKSLSIVEAAYQTVLDSWEAVVRKLEGQGMVDPTRVGVSGHSFGTKEVWYAITHSKLFSAAISNGGTDEDPMNYFMGGPDSMARKYYSGVVVHLPNPHDDPKGFWQRLSPALNVSKIIAPVLVQVSDTEYDGIQELYTGMLDAKKPIDIVVFEGEGHQYHEPHHLVVRAERNLDWFRFWFQSVEDPSPAKAAQYHDWQAFCRLQNTEHPQHQLPCIVE